jgi:hypothetical protein
MADDLENRGPQDRARINIHEVHELRYWTKTLGVSSDLLVSAVRAVGPSADRVREYLKGYQEPGMRRPA